jgi:hypothetical protein
MARSVQEPIAHENAQAYAQSSSFGLLDLDGSPTHDCYGDGDQPPLVPRGAHLW